MTGIIDIIEVKYDRISRGSWCSRSFPRMVARGNSCPLLQQVNAQQPKGRPANSFITEVLIGCPPSLEKLALDKTAFHVSKRPDVQEKSDEADE